MVTWTREVSGKDIEKLSDSEYFKESQQDVLIIMGNEIKEK